VLAQTAACGLGGRFDALAGRVVQPAVERTAQAAVFEAAVGEVRAAVRAMAFDEPVLVLILEKNQVLSEDPDRLHRALALHLVHQRNRLPVAAQQLPRRGTGPDARHQLILLFADHSSR
jgi:hypothetical protein